jgi:chromosome segregation ATPase
MARFRIILAATGAVVFLGAAAHALGQASVPAAGAAGSELTQILEEMRGLRADLRQTAAVGSRTQVLLARIQLQEQRILHLDQERTAVVTKRMELERALASAVEAQKRFEETLARNLAPREETANIQAMVLQARRQVDQLTQERSQLVAQENDYLNTLSAEQGRWTDFNAQLDALERALLR